MVRRDIWAQDWPRSSGNRGKLAVKIIASSLRKGNIVEFDGKLYVVLNAESFHPGKGTPTTQVDMRRISDGVKVAQRFKTTEQVERAYVQPEMKVMLSVHEGVPVSIELPQKATLEVVETEPSVKGQTAASSYKPALLSNGVRTMVPPFMSRTLEDCATRLQQCKSFLLTYLAESLAAAILDSCPDVAATAPAR